jgi:hypothetical protein
MWILIAIIIIEWGGSLIKESWTKVDHGEEGVIRAQNRVDVFCAQPLNKEDVVLILIYSLVIA